MDIFPEYFLYSKVDIKQFGEKAHIEYGWSTNLREKILQWNFQAIRCEEEKMDQLEIIYSQLIQDLYTIYKYRHVSPIDKEICFYFLILLYKMVGQIRDLVDGKGEYSIAFRMVYAWYNICPTLSFFALESFVKRADLTHPYGSWKDIKYFCNFLLFKKSLTKNHELIQFGIKLLNKQLKEDENKSKEFFAPSISLVSKWIPREKSKKFGWLNELLALDYFSPFIKSCTNNNPFQVENAVKKGQMEYRKLISKLNKICETIEIKQCEKNWRSIDFQKVTSVGLWKKNASFLNSSNKKEKDRIICANQFNKFLNDNQIKLDGNIKGKNIYLGDFTKKALFYLKLLEKFPQNENIYSQIKLLDEQWKNNSKNIFMFGKMIAIVDISDTMTEESQNLAIAIGIKIAEKSILGKRILLFGSNTQWINLETCDSFTSMVKKINQIKQNDLALHANFYPSIEMIFKGMKEVNLTLFEIQNLLLVIISDMQIDAFKNNKNNLYWEIKHKFYKEGRDFYGKKVQPPPILFWNVRTTNGFPCLLNQENCFMISGNHPFLLNYFKEEKFKTSFQNPSFQPPTPWSILIYSLENKRYKIMEIKGKECL